MGLPNTVNQLFNGGSPYYIVNRSLRFRASATAYLNRTFAAGNQQKWTWSGWVKRGALGAINYFLEGYPATAGNTNDRTQFYFNSNNTFEYSTITLGVVTEQLTTTQVFRDPSAWYHIIVALDTTQATASNRLKIYINGTQVTAFSTATYPALNASPYINSAKAHYFGAAYNGSFVASTYFDGYAAEMNFVDGQQLTPSSFGAFDTNGIWQPIRYAGTYGTNGFYLPFVDTSSTTNIVKDASGNGNNWTPNNISLTSGTTYDSMLDSPTNSNVGGNFCVWNAVFTENSIPNATMSNGNLKATAPTTSSVYAFGTIGVSTGKWYWENKIDGLPSVGTLYLGLAQTSPYVSTYIRAYRHDTGEYYNGTAWAAYGATYTTGDVIGIALDLDNQTLTFYKNGVSQGQKTSIGLTGITVFPEAYLNYSTASVSTTFGQQPFTYTPPSGYNALNTANLPQPTISYGAPYMNAITYTGYGPLIPSGLGIPTKRNALNQNVSRSLRFRSSASAYLTRTPSVASGFNQWTLSVWFKRCAVGSTQYFIGGNTTTSGNRNELKVEIGSNNLLSVYAFNNGGGYYFNRFSSMVFTDPSSWNHLVVQFDPDNATSANKIIAYINGSQVVWGSSADSGVSGTITSTAYRSINNTFRNDINAGYQNGGAPVYFSDNYLAQMYMVSGSLVAASSFGETNSDGVWVPKSYTGTYGTNGFYLPFTDITSTATLGNDSSGNGNTWTVNNISLTAGPTYDSMIDSPTDYASASNYNVINPLNLGAGSSSSFLVAGNLNFGDTTDGAAASGDNSGFRSTIGVTSGKWYIEGTKLNATTNQRGFGFGTPSIALGTWNGGPTNNLTNTNDQFIGMDPNTATAFIKTGSNAATTVASSIATAQNTVYAIALDLDNNQVTFYVNGSQVGSTTSFTRPDSSAVYYVTFSQQSTWNRPGWAMNFGQRPFSYTPPTGYNSLNTYNLTAPSKTWFSSANNSGRGSATAYPDFVWIKSRSSAQNHSLNDTLRGPTLNLISNATNAEAGASTMFSVNKYGLTLGNDASVNSSSYTDVMWGWQAGQGTTSTNTSGSITSTVSVSASSGFSIVSYTGTGALATVGHSLGVAPNMIIWKSRSAVENWVVYHSSLGATGNVYLNLTNGFSADSTTQNNTAPTSSVFTVATSGAVNGSAKNIVAYCFAAVRNYSAFGSYNGTGSSDGPFIYTGFRPRWIMVKRTDALGYDWAIMDTSRDSYNVAYQTLWSNLSSAEYTTTGSTGMATDILSNGFKIRGTNTENNASGGTYIYAAFAESPFNISRAR